MKVSSNAYKQGFWKEHSESWKASGLTQQAYCEQEGVSYRSFVYQHNRLASQSKKASLKFIEAKPGSVAINNQAAGLQLML
ncbi:IS66 family insertion sequence element accessory protein TnpA, partial [Legionella moravica]